MSLLRTGLDAIQAEVKTLSPRPGEVVVIRGKQPFPLEAVKALTDLVPDGVKVAFCEWGTDLEVEEDVPEIRRLEGVIQRLREELKGARGDVIPIEMVAALMPGAIEQERVNNWIHFHPELFCHLCLRRNVTSWSAPSEVWNRLTDENGTIDGAGIVCPTCFVDRYTARFDMQCIVGITDVYAPNTEEASSGR